MDVDRTPLRVVKIGGSLLDCPDLPARLRRWFARARGMNLIVVGGGRFADAVRQYDAALGLGERAHWLAIRAMRLSGYLVAETLPGAKPNVRYDQLPRDEPTVDPCSVWIVDALDFVERLPAELALPATWSVTSDSIAARLAQAVNADELVLLKSTLPGNIATFNDARAAALVDDYFPIAAQRLGEARLVNLRDGDFPEILLKREPIG